MMFLVYILDDGNVADRVIVQKVALKIVSKRGRLEGVSSKFGTVVEDDRKRPAGTALLYIFTFSAPTKVSF